MALHLGKRGRAAQGKSSAGGNHGDNGHTRGEWELEVWRSCNILRLVGDSDGDSDLATVTYEHVNNYCS